MSMRRKVFQKPLNSTQIFQNQDFQSIEIAIKIFGLSLPDSIDV